MSEGLATVRRDGRAPEVARLVELEDAAKAAGKGKWGGNPSVSSSLLLCFTISSSLKVAITHGFIFIRSMSVISSGPLKTLWHLWTRWVRNLSKQLLNM